MKVRAPDNESETVLDLLRLFKLASVVGIKSTLSAKSIIQFAFGTSPNIVVGAIYKEGFSASDVDSFKSFVHTMTPLLAADKAEEMNASNKATSIGIALSRYKEALLQPGLVESRITSAITCFEALYLKAHERMELSHRLAQRVAALLRLIDFEPLKVYGEVTRAYEIRSTFIHGSPIDADQKTSAQKLCDAIMNYARISLVLLLQLQSKVDKEGFISKLDNSLMDEKALSRLRQFLEKDILIPG